MDRLLNSVYNNSNSSAYLAGAGTVYRVAKEKNQKITLRDVKEFLHKQNTYTLHKPVLRRFPRNKVDSVALDYDWQIDLVDLRSLKKYNNGYTMLLTCIDVFSRYGWAVPLKNKQPVTVLAAFKEILDSGRKPWRVMSDSGTEFKAVFKQFLKDNEIHYFTATSPDVKASNIERWNRTLKTRMWKHFTKDKTFKYLDVLPKLVHAINHTVSRVTKHAPVDVTISNEQYVKSIINDTPLPKPPNFLFKVGDKVRITKEKGKLSKGYIPNFKEEIYTVTERLHRHPATYRLTADDGESITGIFYNSELVAYNPTKVYKKVTKKRRRRY